MRDSRDFRQRGTHQIDLGKYSHKDRMAANGSSTSRHQREANLFICVTPFDARKGNRRDGYGTDFLRNRLEVEVRVCLMSDGGNLIPLTCIDPKVASNLLG